MKVEDMILGMRENAACLERWYAGGKWEGKSYYEVQWAALTLGECIRIEAGCTPSAKLVARAKGVPA